MEAPEQVQEKAAHKINRKSSRAVVIDNPTDFVIAFANVTTTVSENTDDWVARNGDKSVFSVLRLILPEVSHAAALA